MRLNISIVVLTLLSVQFAVSQLPTYHVGRAPTAQEIKEQDTYVGPSGEGLPQGRGNAKDGAKIFEQKCALCHGPTGVEGKYPKLKTKSTRPFATTIWSMINSSMPRSIPDVGVRAEKLPINDVYALTAFVLHLNGLVAEDAVIDQTNLARVKMPSRNAQLEAMVELAK
jgi:S-disulfanyl-L-cysteine oxidoreductase SoxD